MNKPIPVYKNLLEELHAVEAKRFEDMRAEAKEWAEVVYADVRIALLGAAQSGEREVVFQHEVVPQGGWGALEKMLIEQGVQVQNVGGALKITWAQLKESP